MKHLSLTLFSLLLLSSSVFGASLSSQATSSSLIVYNAGIGLVHEQRNLDLDKDDRQIIYENVATSIDADSVNINLPESVTLLSQQYHFDKLSIYKLLDAHIGKKVKLKDKEVILLSHSGVNALVKDVNNDIVSVLSKDIVFEKIPSSLFTKPSLVFNIDAKSSLKTEMQMEYLVKNISWQSNYILNVNEKKADLLGWISIDNTSGKAYKNTQLHVLAGDINIAKKVQTKNRYERAVNLMSDATNVFHQSYEGYHLYSVPFKLDINNGKTQIKFISKKSIPIVHKYTSIMTNPLYLNTQINHNVMQSLEIQKLNFALPKGTVRTYSKLKEQTVLLGEASLNHTPINTPLSIKVGSNFDIKVKETIQQRSNTKSFLDSSVLYSLENNSDDKKTLELLIPFNKNSTSTIETSHEYAFVQGNQLSFKVDLDAKDAKNILVRFRSRR
jgi:hypothetical protein